MADLIVLERDGAKYQQWACQLCGTECERLAVRGQRPKWCDDCRNKGWRVHKLDEVRRQDREHRRRVRGSKPRPTPPSPLSRYAAKLTREPTKREVAAYKRALKQDPCAYCGQSPSGGIDHITPRAHDGSRTDWNNMTACCKRCNETKRTLPLLRALLWIPVSRTYHDMRRSLAGHWT